MSSSINDDQVDIVIAALKPDLTSFFEEWRTIFSRFHLIIVKDPDLQDQLQIPPGFDHRVYTKSDIEKLAGTSSIFSGYSCRYFGYLVSRKRYVISVDDDCIPARDENGRLVDAVDQHLFNLATPATPFFFNTLYDPYRPGADFVRGYPFSLRQGVGCALSCGLWLNLSDYDAPTEILKSGERNRRYVDAVMTVPARALLPVSGINIGFDRSLIGPVMFSGLQVTAEGKRRYETVEDVWCGMCVKVTCDHLGLGVKTGLPYVWRGEEGAEEGALASLKREWEGVKLMEVVVPFFQAARIPRTAVTPEDCFVEIAKAAREKLGPLDQVFARAADAMDEWIKIWKAIGGSEELGE